MAKATSWYFITLIVLLAQLTVGVTYSGQKPNHYVSAGNSNGNPSYLPDRQSNDNNNVNSRNTLVSEKVVRGGEFVLHHKIVNMGKPHKNAQGELVQDRGDQITVYDKKTKAKKQFWPLAVGSLAIKAIPVVKSVFSGIKNIFRRRKHKRLRRLSSDNDQLEEADDSILNTKRNRVFRS